MGHVLAWVIHRDLNMALRLAGELRWWWWLRGGLPGQYPLLRELAECAAPSSDGWCTAQFWLALRARDTIFWTSCVCRQDRMCGPRTRWPGWSGLQLAVMPGLLVAVTASPRRAVPGWPRWPGLPGACLAGQSGPGPVVRQPVGNYDAVAVGLGTPSGPGTGRTEEKRSPSASGTPGRDRTWTLARVQGAAGVLHGPGRARHVVAEADRRAASARSRNTAAVAATRAAPTAIRVICQPAMPPTITGTAAGGGSPPPGGITLTAQAAGMMAAEASRTQVRAARAAAARRSRPARAGGAGG